ncbi:MAG: IS66 family transposase [Ginsengibacter sp.]
MQTTVDHKKLYEEQVKITRYQAKKIDELSFKLQELAHQLFQFKKLTFGSKHERFIPSDPQQETSQIALDLEVETVGECKITDVKEIKYLRTKTEVTKNIKPHPGRNALPSNLRRETIFLTPDMDTSNLQKIGEEITEVLDLIPGEFYVKQFIRAKYVVPVSDTNNTIITASLPERILEKSMFGEGIVAQILVDKYCDHLPLHRQLQRFSRVGVNVPQSTITSLVSRALNELGAIFEAHKKDVLSSGYLHADETHIKVMDESKKGTTHQGYYWLYHDSLRKLVLFDYRPGRDRAGPENILKDFQGYLQVDGYVAYESFEKRQGIQVLNCMAHARRKFIDAAQNDPGRAEEALLRFQKLYEMERVIRDWNFPPEDALELRQRQSVEVLKEFKEWLTDEYQKVLPSSAIGRAIAYCLPRWEKLSLYTTNGILQIDNNPVENAVRPVAIGRKNYLFAGSHDAAQRAAMIYSLVATCRMHNINPFDWLKDVFERMHLYTTKNIHELLPQNWKKKEEN